MFYHVKELQFNARVSKPDPAFATLLLEQFGGANGEPAAAMHAFPAAPDGKSILPGARVNHFVIIHSAIWATHTLTLSDQKGRQRAKRETAVKTRSKHKTAVADHIVDACEFPKGGSA